MAAFSMKGPLVERLDGPGKEFPRMATDADHANLKDAYKAFNKTSALRAAALLKDGHVFKWVGLKVETLAVNALGQFVARQPVVVLDKQGEGKDARIRFATGKMGTAVLKGPAKTP